MNKAFRNRIIGPLMIFALVLNIFYPFAKVFAASTYTITYQDANGAVIATQTATDGTTVTLNNYPSGAIAWVDTSSAAVANAQVVNSAARGMAYVNYSSTDPNNSSPAPSNMTFLMPASDVTLTAFYGDYQNNNEPRLFQFHLELKYHDVNSGCDLAFAQQYRNTNVPSGFVVNLPDENYFAPMSVTATNCANPANNQTITSGLTIYKWVDDESYTGVTVVPDNKLFDPSQMIFVDPNDYNQIYDVMVNQQFDFITGSPVAPPIGTVPPGSYQTITFNIDPTVYDSDGNATATTSFSIGAGFSYSNLQASGAVACTSVACTDNYAESTIPTGTTWADWFGLQSSPTTVNFPASNTIAGFGSYWTADGGTAPLAPGAIAPNTTITSNHTYTLHYTQNPPAPTTIITVRLNTGSFQYDSTAHTVTGWNVVNINGADTSTSGLTATDETTPITLPDGNILLFSGRDLSYVSATAVGTYPLALTSHDFSVWTAPASSGGIPVPGYQITTLWGGMTITPLFTDTTNPPAPAIPGAPKTPGTGQGSTDKSFSPAAFPFFNFILSLGLIILITRRITKPKTNPAESSQDDII